MKISDLLSPTEIMIDVRASQKATLLQELAAIAAASLGLPADQVTSHLLKREELGSTGIGQGIAIPHSRLPDLKRPYGLLAKLKQGIEFDAIDGQAVDVVFVLLLPAAAENEALAALALVARTLRSPDTRARLRAASGRTSRFISRMRGRVDIWTWPMNRPRKRSRRSSTRHSGPAFGAKRASSPRYRSRWRRPIGPCARCYSSGRCGSHRTR